MQVSRSIQSRKQTATDGNRYNPYVKEVIDLGIVLVNITSENLIPYSKSAKAHEIISDRFLENLYRVDSLADSCKMQIGYAERKKTSRFIQLDELSMTSIRLSELAVNNSIFLGSKKERILRITKNFIESVGELKDMLEGCGAQDIRVVQNKAKEEIKDKGNRLPLVILRPAISISLKKAEAAGRAYPNSTEIGGAIAIATANAQKAGYLIKGTRTLTMKGHIKEKEHEENLDYDKLAIFEYALFINKKRR